MSLIFKGSRSYPKEKLNKTLYKYGIDAGGSTLSDFSLISAKTIVKYLPKTLHLVSDVLMNPLLEEKEFDVIKDKMLASLKSEVDSPDSLADKELKDYFFYGHPYYLRDIGRIDSVTKIDLRKVKQHHKKMLDASRITIVVVGNLNRCELKKELNKHFGNITSKSSSYNEIPKFVRAKKPKIIINRKEKIPHSIVEGIFEAPNYEHKDIEPLRIGIEILNKRLWNEVRTKRALVYGVYVGLSSRKTNYGVLYYSSRKPIEAYKIVKIEINKMKETLISKKELKNSIELFVTSYWMRNETAASQGGSLIFFDFLGGTYRRFYSHMDRIFQVTPVDVQRVMKKYLQNLSFSVVTVSKDLKIENFVL